MPAAGELPPPTPSPRAIPSIRAPLQPGELFFAVRGERLDGHDYVEAALAKGAVAAVVEQKQLSAISPSQSALLVVDDSLTALQRWARRCAGCGASR